MDVKIIDKQPVLNDNYIISNGELNILLFTYPILTCVAFWFNTFTKSKIDPGSYFTILITIYLYSIVSSTEKNYIYKSIITLFGVAFFCSLYFLTNFKDAILYVANLNCIIYGLFILPKIDFSQINLKKLRKNLIIFSIAFVIVYEISSHFAKIHLNESDDSFDVVRKYKEGFIISHFATYYLGSLGLLLFLLRRKYLAILLWIYSYSLGARIGLVYIVGALSFIFLLYFKTINYYVYKYKYILLILIAFIITVLTRQILATSGIDGLMVYTSGRSIFWLFGINQISADGLSLGNLFGRGPGSTILLNMDRLGVKIWMHNDFIELMYTFGVLGLLIYIASFVKYFKKVKSFYLFIVFFLSAFFNGFMTYDPLFIIIVNTFIYQRFMNYE